MGMSGNYLALDDALVQRIAAGEKNLGELNPSDYPGLDIDKSWQAIHYLLCRDIADGEPPLGYVVPMMGDQFLEAPELGEFGAFYLRSAQVAEALLVMEELDDGRLRSMYDFPAMLEDQVYPIATGEDGEAMRDYMLDYFKQIRQFYRQAASDGNGIVFYIF